MMTLRYLLSLTMLAFALGHSCAEEKSGILGEIELKWPGIHYQVMFVKRIPADRLLVGVRIVATATAPAAGTLIGIPVPIPPNANKYDIAAGYYHPLPFSLASSGMVDDLSQRKFPALAPIVQYRSAAILAYLKPGQGHLLTLQFAVPPPPPPVSDAGQTPPAQTVSFYFTNAKGGINKIALPPPGNLKP
jgi:hypothetical protein